MDSAALLRTGNFHYKCSVLFDSVYIYVLYLDICVVHCVHTTLYWYVCLSSEIEHLLSQKASLLLSLLLNMGFFYVLGNCRSLVVWVVSWVYERDGRWDGRLQGGRVWWSLTQESEPAMTPSPPPPRGCRYHTWEPELPWPGQVLRDLELHVQMVHVLSAQQNAPTTAPSINCSKPAQLLRPELQEEATEQDWAHWKVNWERYKRSCLIWKQVGITLTQSRSCCSWWRGWGSRSRMSYWTRLCSWTCLKTQDNQWRTFPTTLIIWYSTSWSEDSMTRALRSTCRRAQQLRITKDLWAMSFVLCLTSTMHRRYF